MLIIKTFDPQNFTVNIDAAPFKIVFNEESGARIFILSSLVGVDDGYL